MCIVCVWSLLVLFGQGHRKQPLCLIRLLHPTIFPSDFSSSLLSLCLCLSLSVSLLASAAVCQCVSVYFSHSAGLSFLRVAGRLSDVAFRFSVYAVRTFWNGLNSSETR